MTKIFSPPLFFLLSSLFVSCVTLPKVDLAAEKNDFVVILEYRLEKGFSGILHAELYDDVNGTVLAENIFHPKSQGRIFLGSRLESPVTARLAVRFEDDDGNISERVPLDYAFKVSPGYIYAQNYYLNIHRYGGVEYLLDKKGDTAAQKKTISEGFAALKTIDGDYDYFSKVSLMRTPTVKGSAKVTSSVSSPPSGRSVNSIYTVLSSSLLDKIRPQVPAESMSEFLGYYRTVGNYYVLKDSTLPSNAAKNGFLRKFGLEYFFYKPFVYEQIPLNLLPEQIEYLRSLSLSARLSALLGEYREYGLIEKSLYVFRNSSPHVGYGYAETLSVADKMDLADLCLSLTPDKRAMVTFGSSGSIGTVYFTMDSFQKSVQPNLRSHGVSDAEFLSLFESIETDVAGKRDTLYTLSKNYYRMSDAEKAVLKASLK